MLGNVSTQIQSESNTTDGDSSSSTNLAESIGVDVADIDAQGELDLSSAATTTLNAKAEVTNSTEDTESVEGAKAGNTFTTARGTRLTSIDAGDDTNFNAIVGISTNAEANAATGSSEAINNASDIAALELTSSEQQKLHAYKVLTLMESSVPSPLSLRLMQVQHPVQRLPSITLVL